ncbi:MAG: sugar transferase, partial [Solirubrobacterales bacterium]|nr:sugar transferase [Solirubrobacterales bacterium]
EHADLAEVVGRLGIDRVLVSHNDIDEPQMVAMLHQCRRLGIKMTVVPRLFDALGPAVALDEVEGITVLGINPPVLSRSSRALKRLMDVVGAFFALVLSAPVLLVIVLAIKLDSKGTVLFRQQRIGRGGKRFWLVKFRTMRPDAEAMTAELLSASEDPHWLKLDHDPRVTRVGRKLRMLSLDELPQLWNVLKGEMSLVGPRPLIEREAHQLEEWAWARIDLTPGLTGLWQVLGRTNIPFAEMAKLDYVYVTNWSLWGDIRLLLRTLPVVFSRRGAN